jgi:glycosyltransferase involved in cell wall biosynthesis
MASRRLKLLVLTPTFPYPPTSGGDIRVFHLLRRLSRTFEVHLLPTGKGNVERLVSQTGIAAVHAVDRVSPRVTGSSLSRAIDFWRYSPHEINLDVDPAYASALAAVLTAVDIDVVLIEHLYMMQYAPLVGSLPVCYSATDVETIKFARWHGSERLSPKRRLLHWAQHKVIARYEGRLGDRARVTFTTSESDREFLQRLNRRGRFVVAPNGVDLEYFHCRTRESFDGPAAAFFVGTMYYKPNHDAAVVLARDVFPRVRAELPGAVCHIAGKTNEHDYSALNQPERGVFMHGFVDDVRPYLALSQVLVVPLLAGSGTRIKILEAMASGTPVVSTAVGAEGIDYTDGDNIVIANGPAAIADAVIGLLRDRARCFEIGRAGRRLVEQKYSWDASADVVRSEILLAAEPAVSGTR